MTSGEVYQSANRVYFRGILKAEMIPLTMRMIDRVVDEARYPNLTIDMSAVEMAYGSFLTIVLARLRYLQANRIEVSVIEPERKSELEHLGKLNWLAHLGIKGARMRAARPDRSIPILPFSDADAQGRAIDCISKSLLLQIKGLERAQVRAAQWAISEITDNVLNHANSLTGGLAYAQIHHSKQLIEFVVADSGMGIPRSLGELDAGLALEKAITEGVTRNRQTNQGNGLYGTWRLATLSKGIFAIHSYRGVLFVRPDGSVKVDPKSYRYPGTFVIFQIDFSDPALISEALMFKGVVHEPGFDFIEKEFETTDDNLYRVKLKDHVVSTGSRESGKKIANLLENVIRMAGTANVEIDFDDILVVSSSFADECSGRLIANLGPAEFFSRVSFKNTDQALRAIIDRSVMQRMRFVGLSNE